jgi:hypothetical protein
MMGEDQFSTDGIDRHDQIMAHQFARRVCHFMRAAMCHVQWELAWHIHASIYSRDLEDHHGKA